MADLDDAHGRADLHQRRDPDRLTGSVDDRVGVGIVELHPARKPFGERRKPCERTIRHVSPHMVVAVDGLPQGRVVMLRERLDPAVAARKRHRPGAARRRRIDLYADRLAGNLVRPGDVRHRFFMFSLKKRLSSALGTVPAKLSNLPVSAISRAARMVAVQATRASVPPTLIRRTPSPARSLTVKSVALDMRKFTGFGATALTTAAVCSRVLIPGA